MPIYELTTGSLKEVSTTRFGDIGVGERSDLQRLLRDQIEILAPDAMVLCEEFGDWSDSQRRIDLLLLDREARFVVVELKRTEDGGHMDLQAIRYAAMVSTMTFGQAVAAHEKYLSQRGIDEDAEQRILDFWGREEPSEDDFGQSVSIVLASAEFSKEITSAVLWLNMQGLDIRCVRMKPYANGDQILVDVQPIIPLPEAEEFQVRVADKKRQERADQNAQWTEARLLAEIASEHGEDARAVAGKLLAWGEQQADYVWWGKGKDVGMAIPIIRSAGIKYHLYRVVTNGMMVFMIDSLHKKPPFDRPDVLKELSRRLGEVDGKQIGEEGLRNRRRIPLALLADPRLLEKAQEAVDWMIGLLGEAATSNGGTHAD